MGRVIRAARTGPAIVPAELYDAKREAQALLASAHAEAERIRADAAASGREQARAEAAVQLLELSHARASALRDAERDVIEAALRIAGHIVGREVERDPEILAAMVVPLVRRLRRAKRVRIRVHPDDAAALERTLEQTRAAAELDGLLELERDASLLRGDCVVESDTGDIDARISTRIEALSRALLGDGGRS